jgi:hypothetical protein
MSKVHEYVGFAVVVIFAVGWIWGLAAWIFRRGKGPGDGFWQWLTVAQVVAVLQALIGLLLLAMGKRPTSWLHYVYGFGPLIILFIAHLLARDLRKTQPGKTPIPLWVPFALASFICFGLSLRGLMTGLGAG